VTPRDIVVATLSYDRPERVARSFGDADMVFAGPSIKTAATDWHPVGGARWERTDEWGNLWARVDASSKGEVIHGVLDRLDALDDYELPRLDDPAGYEPVRRVRLDHPDRYVVGGLPGFAFNIARKLRRLDVYLTDLLADRPAVAALHDRIDDLLAGMIRRYAECGCDAVMITEDWGTQQHLLIDPALWRDEFAPRFDRLCGLARSLGLSVWMHSCGQIEAIVPDLMTAGVDCLQFDQPELHGLETLAAHQDRGRITFWCPVDIQKTLQSRDEAVIRAAARRMLDTLWRGRGGFIAGFYGDNASIGLDPVWQDHACDEFLRAGIADNYPE